MPTLMQDAADGKITSEMREVAKKENISASKVARLLSSGRLIIPANRRHLKMGLKPVGIGKCASVKVNANIGASQAGSCIEAEMQKLAACLEYGADTVMDLSAGVRNMDEIRVAMIRNSPIPLGTVPIYQAAEGSNIGKIPERAFIDAIRKQAEQGVDYMTIHAGILRRHAKLANRRVTGIVSRGGAIMNAWMEENGAENPLYENFDEILDVCEKHDVTISLGDSLRPGCTADASDSAQLAELRTLGSLVSRCRKRGVQSMVEGPGHVPIHKIADNVRLQKRICNGAPFYVLGPLVCDVGAGYDHITAAIGGALAAYAGADFLCYVTPKEHLGLPNLADVREGIIASRIAAHAADIAHGIPGAARRDLEMSRARYDMDWEKQFALSLDPKRARGFREANGLSTCADFCSMCGPAYCAMRLHHQSSGRKTFNQRRKK
jgi:phosphomethylpyrimidine synthase